VDFFIDGAGLFGAGALRKGLEEDGWGGVCVSGSTGRGNVHVIRVFGLIGWVGFVLDETEALDTAAAKGLAYTNLTAKCNRLLIIRTTNRTVQASALIM
jgi:hypothetical protein